MAAELAARLKFTESRLSFLVASLQTEYKEKALEALTALGPAAHEAVPTLVKLEKHLDREPLASALRVLDPTGELSVPLIQPGLESQAEVWRTLDLLDQMDTRQARRAVDAYLRSHPGSEKQLEHVRSLRAVGDVGM